MHGAIWNHTEDEMSAYSDYAAGLITRDQLAAEARREAWLDDYYEDQRRRELDEDEDEEEYE